MNIKLNIIFFWIVVMFISSSLFLCVDTVYTDSGIKNNRDVTNSATSSEPNPSERNSDATKFQYYQRPIRKVKEKNVKIKVAISRFEDKTEIEGSPFNIQKDREKESGDAKDINITIKADERIEEEKLSKSELLTGLLTDGLRRTGMFEVIERDEINELIREINFQNSKWVKKENINTLGNIFGVQYIVTGDILRSKAGEKIGKDYYALALRMYNVNTGEIVSSSVANAPYLRGAADKAVKDLAAQIKSKAWTCRVIGISDAGIHINAGLKDDLEKREIFYIVRVGNEIIDPETKKTLGFDKKKIALIEVKEVLDENLSRARVIEEYDRITVGDIVLAERIDKKKKSELALWRKIQAAQKIGKKGSQEDLDKYSLTSYIYSPEDIMANFGNSVVKIQSDGGMGSGFVINSDGYIVTNFHVVQDAKFVNVKMIEHNKYITGVQVVRVNPARDIALLKANNAGELQPVILGDSDNIKIGEQVVAIGNPQGFENTISDGLISGIRESADVKLIQTSVPVTEGSSGGPLLNMEGEVIGVVTAGFKKEGNINFAVPINYVKEELL